VKKALLLLGAVLLAVGVLTAQQPPIAKGPLSQRREPTSLERAKQLAQKGDWQAARKELETFVKKQPENIEARKLLVESLLQLNEFSQALSHLQWLSRKLPKDPRVWSALGQVQEHIGQLDEARNSLRKAVHLQPSEPEFRVHLARVLVALDKWDDAAHHLRWLAHRMPDLASVQYHLALYYERTGNFRKAFHHAKRTVQLSPKEPDARLALARIALKLGEAKTAAEQVEALTKQFPSDPQLAMECAKLFAQAGDVDRAIRYFRRTLHLQPENADAHRSIADLYSQRGEWSKALWHVRWLSKRFPKDPEIASAEAQCYAQLHRYRDAERSLLRWANLSPKDFEPFVLLARLYGSLGDGSKARMAYGEALKRRPPVEVIGEAAEFEEQLGDFERAAKLYEWAQKRQPENPLWRALRAEAMMKAGKFDNAGRVLRSALKRFPDDPHINLLMGIWHAKRVEWVEAEQFLLRGIRRLAQGERVNTGNKAKGGENSLTVPRPPSRTPFLDAVGVLVEIWLCQGRAREAVRLCDELLRKRPSPELLIWWAQGMDELGKTKEAAQRLERSQMFARDERVAKAAARLWELAGEREKAASVWERFAQLVPDKKEKVEAFLQAAKVWERNDQIPKALAVLSKAQNIADEPILKAERIRLMLKANAPAAALDEAGKLLAMFPNEPQAAMLYAEAALQLWGESAFERVAERWQKETNLTGALLLIAERLNRREDAEKLLKSRTALLLPKDRKLVHRWLEDFSEHANPKPPIPDPQSLLERAKQRAEESRVSEALELCRKAIALHRDFLPAYELLLQLYQRRKDLEHAVKGFTQLANRDRNDLTLNFAAATALSLSGQYRRAIPYWRRVCALTANSPDAMLKLAECLEEAREDTQAQWVKKFVKRLERWEVF